MYTEPVYYALAGQGFEQVAVINPAHAKALKGHKTDAKDCVRLAELFECGLLRGSYIPPQELKDLRDLTRYRAKTVQARTSEIQRLAKALESAGIKLDSVVSDLTGKSATLMIEALIDGERRGQVLADLAIGRMRTGRAMPVRLLRRWRCRISAADTSGRPVLRIRPATGLARPPRMSRFRGAFGGPQPRSEPRRDRGDLAPAPPLSVHLADAGPGYVCKHARVPLPVGSSRSASSSPGLSAWPD